MSGINRKKIIIIISIVSVLIMIFFSAFRIIVRHKQIFSEQVEDTNGDSKELCYLTDEMIETQFESYHSYKYHYYRKGLNASGVEGKYEDCDVEYVETKFGMISGIYVSNAFLGDGNKVSYRIKSRVDKGNMRIVITDDYGKILYDVPIDTDYTLDFVSEKGETYYVKFVTESAKIKVEIWRDVEES